MTTLAALPQHVAQIVGVSLGICFVGFGLLLLLKGPPNGTDRRLSARGTRLIAGIQLLLGVGVGAAFFFVDAEGRQRQAGEGHWGGAFGIAMLGIWLAVLGAIAAYNLRKFLK